MNLAFFEAIEDKHLHFLTQAMIKCQGLRHPH